MSFLSCKNGPSGGSIKYSTGDFLTQFSSEVPISLGFKPRWLQVWSTASMNQGCIYNEDYDSTSVYIIGTNGLTKTVGATTTTAANAFRITNDGFIMNKTSSNNRPYKYLAMG